MWGWVRLSRLRDSPHRDRTKSTHVDASVGRHADPGSIPGASTTTPCFPRLFFAGVCSRIHIGSTSWPDRGHQCLVGEPRVTPRRTRIAMPEQRLQDAFADTLAQQIGRAAVLRSLVEARLDAGRGAGRLPHLSQARLRPRSCGPPALAAVGQGEQRSPERRASRGTCCAIQSASSSGTGRRFTSRFFVTPIVSQPGSPGA